MESDGAYPIADYAELIESTIEECGPLPSLSYLLDSGEIIRYTYLEVGAMIDETIAELERMGLTPGDRVFAVAPASIHYFILILALGRMGVVGAYADPMLSADDLGRLIDMVEPRAVFSTDAVLSKIDACWIDGMPLFAIGEGGRIISHIPGSPNETVGPTADKVDDVAMIMFSSGTTGRIKGVEVTYDSVIRAIRINVKALDLEDSLGHHRYLQVLPLNHLSGFLSTMVLFVNGAEIDMIEDVGPSKYALGLKTFEPTVFVTVPVVFAVMEDRIREAVREKGALTNIVFNIMLSLAGFFRYRLGIRFGRGFFKRITAPVFEPCIEKLSTGEALPRGRGAHPHPVPRRRAHPGRSAAAVQRRRGGALDEDREGHTAGRNRRRVRDIPEEPGEAPQDNITEEAQAAHSIRRGDAPIGLCKPRGDDTGTQGQGVRVDPEPLIRKAATLRALMPAEGRACRLS